MIFVLDFLGKFCPCEEVFETAWDERSSCPVAVLFQKKRTRDGRKVGKKNRENFT